MAWSWQGSSGQLEPPDQAWKSRLEPIAGDHWRVWFSFYEIGVLDSEKLVIRRPERKPTQERNDASAGQGAARLRCLGANSGRPTGSLRSRSPNGRLTSPP